MPFQKGHKLATGRPKGSKSITTLIKEERRARFDAKISEKWEKIIDELKPEYVADQFMGKATDNVDITSGGKPLPLLDFTNVREDNSNKKDTSPDEEDSSGTGGNGGIENDLDTPLPDNGSTEG